MQYRGSKNKIAKYILPIMSNYRTNEMTWVEPFVGGANMIDKVEGKRIGADSNEYLIKALCMIRDEPDAIPDLITEDDYAKAKNEMVLNGITGFIGFAMSFGGKWFATYAREVAGTKGCIKNMRTQTRRGKQNALKQSKYLKGVNFTCCSYQNLHIPPNSLIYCDPPYENTTKYNNTRFNHDEFWEWCRNKSKEGHVVFISEYNAPNDFKCLWEKEIPITLNNTTNKTVEKSTEKLFLAPYCNKKVEKTLIQKLFE